MSEGRVYVTPKTRSSTCYLKPLMVCKQATLVFTILTTGTSVTNIVILSLFVQSSHTHSISLIIDSAILLVIVSMTVVFSPYLLS